MKNLILFAALLLVFACTKTNNSTSNNSISTITNTVGTNSITIRSCNKSNSYTRLTYKKTIPYCNIIQNYNSALVLSFIDSNISTPYLQIQTKLTDVGVDSFLTSPTTSTYQGDIILQFSNQFVCTSDTDKILTYSWDNNNFPYVKNNYLHITRYDKNKGGLVEGTYNFKLFSLNLDTVLVNGSFSAKLN